MTTGTETDTVPRETPALPLTLPEGAPTTSVGTDLLADAKAEALSWSPNTRRAYVAGWNDFTSWCIEHRCAGLPSAAADVGRYIEHLVEMEGKTLATARLRLAAIAAAHRLGGHSDPTSRPLVKATVKRMAREYGKPRKQAKGLTSEALGAGQGHGADPADSPRQAPAQGDRGPGRHASRGGRGAHGGDAGWSASRLRGLGAPLGRARVPRRRLGPVARGKVKDRPDGRGGSAVPGPHGRGRPAGHPAPGGRDGPGRQRLRTVGPTDLPENQGGHEDGGLGRRVQCPLAQGGHGPGLERRGGGATGADARWTLGQPRHAGQVHRVPGRRQGRGGSLSPGKPTEVSLMHSSRAQVWA